jgi:hypothetical protein
MRLVGFQGFGGSKVSALLSELIGETHRYLDGHVAARDLMGFAAVRIQPIIDANDTDAEGLANDIVTGVVRVDEQIINMDEFKDSLQRHVAKLEAVVT